jgi:hypothetical protein
MSNTEEKMHPIIKELNELKVILKDYTLIEIREYIKKNMDEEVEILKKDFYKDFEDIDDNDMAKIMVINTLQDYGIIV